MKHLLKLSPAHLLVLSAYLAVSIAPAAAAESAEEIINRARSHLAEEKVLDAVKSIRFTGTILLQDGRNGDIEILVQKPMQQRVTITLGNVREITALSGYDGWRRLEPVGAPSQWELTLLEAPQIQRLRANMVENIGFFKGTKLADGSIELLDESEMDGAKCVKVAFNHGRRVRFIRYFEKATGKLVVTVTDDGSVLREKGEIRAGGIRFPKELETTTKAGKSTVIFTRIQVNEKFDSDLFDVPLLMPGTRP